MCIPHQSSSLRWVQRSCSLQGRVVRECVGAAGRGCVQDQGLISSRRPGRFTPWSKHTYIYKKMLLSYLKAYRIRDSILLPFRYARAAQDTARRRHMAMREATICSFELQVST